MVSVPAVLLAGSAIAAFAQAPAHPRFSPEIEAFVKNFKPGGQDLTGQIKPLSPPDSLRQLHAADGYVVELAACEPVIRQPIDMRFDDRGRLWVVQFLQYPFPAGLTVTAYDQYLHAEFDRVSPPPPNHFRGADKITILEDRDGDGVYESHQTFLEGLNMATSIELGYGGVWVLQSPYLLFYPDRDGNDVPDGDPEVHLAGFGLEDTSSLASSLHWGPDGWLYGATGSTTNLDIQGVRLLGQGIWRYHPGTKVFEVFAEGGGNTFSFELDKYGRAYSGTNYGATRGLHYAQGATYIKVFSKHGPALHPFIFGFFNHMGHKGDGQRFPQCFISYEGGLWAELEGQIVAGMALTSRVQASQVFKETSTFRTVDSVTLIDSGDKAFRPVDIEAGPDGCIYIADWYDPRITNLNIHDTWDKATGRIFRITPRSFVRPGAVDLRKASTFDLVRFLSSGNRWYREEARKLLAHRTESIGPVLIKMLGANNDAALEALWVLNLRGELDHAGLRMALGHPNQHVRRWAVRLLGDQNSVNANAQAALVALARTESDPEVRSQLASSTKRLPPGQAIPIIRQLLVHDEDADDLHIPLLIWWAIERQLDTGREELVTLMRDPSVWRTRIFSEFIAGRIARRYSMDQGPNKYYTLNQGVYSEWKIERSPEYLRRNLEMCARVLSIAPRQPDVELVIAGMAEGLKGRPVENVPGSLKQIIDQQWSSRTHSVALVTLAVRLGHPAALSEAIGMVRGGQLSTVDQQQLVDLLASTGAVEALPLVADLLRREKNDQRLGGLLEALSVFDIAAAAEAVVDVFPALGPRLQSVARRQLSEKPAWSLVMLQRMTGGKFDPGVLSSSSLALIRAHRNAQIDELLARYQNLRTDDPAERKAQELFEKGKTAYALNCSACHQENGQGLRDLAPSLVASPWVEIGGEPMARIVLHGKTSPARGFVMPSLRHLDDEQIAAAITYVRREFGNKPGAVAPREVAAIRAVAGQRQEPWTNEELARQSR